MQSKQGDAVGCKQCAQLRRQRRSRQEVQVVECGAAAAAVLVQRPDAGAAPSVAVLRHLLNKHEQWKYAFKINGAGCMKRRPSLYSARMSPSLRHLHTPKND